MILSSNKIIDKRHDGDLTITSPFILKISGILNGNVFVQTGSNLEVTGTVNGNVHIDNNAKANISGTVNGTVVSHGYLIVSGILKSLENFSSNITIEPNSIISDKKY